MRAFMSKVKPLGALSQAWYINYDSDHPVMAQSEALSILATTEPGTTEHSHGPEAFFYRASSLARNGEPMAVALAESLTAFVESF